MPSVNRIRFRRSGTRNTLAMASKNLFMDLLCFLRFADQYCLAAGGLDLLLGRPREAVRRDRHRARQLTGTQDFQTSLELLDHTELLQRVEVERIALELVQPVEINDYKLFPENVGESALRKPAMHRHLAAFKPAHLRITGYGP